MKIIGQRDLLSLLRSHGVSSNDVDDGLVVHLHEGKDLENLMGAKGKELRAPKKYPGKRLTYRACLEGYAIWYDGVWHITMPVHSMLNRTNWHWVPWLNRCLKNAAHLAEGGKPYEVVNPITLPTQWTF